ncbi:DMT family transporter [Oceanisphaera avium]|uniref:QacE family quaternary ammonium compound efflux SMR transporter n=1 Tax=Oceanisphaera avium TaxID=1903694 RepID=A0A1Y0D089_9GAMM|nr:SMR family transporter [Oceanisphaera avium]ART81010.1 QacE family quaternary ammonium compound efflux SMR transporter [Oceanisphaera avium]
MPAYALLAIAIIAEVLATSALKASMSFTRLGPSVIVIVGYSVAFWLLTHVVRTMAVGVAYAIWSGAGIVLVTLLAAFFYRQRPDLPAVIGIALIIAGVVIIQLYSRLDGQ